VGKLLLVALLGLLAGALCTLLLTLLVQAANSTV
jgi:hypothetical protein